MTTISCPKCEGRGYIQMYGHVANGVCFSCNGKGTIVERKSRKKRAPQTPERKAELAAKRAEKLIADTIDGYLADAARSKRYNTLFKAEIDVLVVQFLRAIHPNVTLAEARTAGEAMCQSIYRLR